jgi:hypothetical protein
MAQQETRSVVITLRVRPSLKAALRKLAERERRTLASWIELSLEQAIKDADKRKH